MFIWIVTYLGYTKNMLFVLAYLINETHFPSTFLSNEFEFCEIIQPKQPLFSLSIIRLREMLDKLESLVRKIIYTCLYQMECKDYSV